MFQKTEQLFQQAQQYIPGGVNSPARAFKSVGGTPIFFEKAKGSWVYDVDGNEYIDYVSSWGPMILGHAYEPVLEAVREQAEKSTSFGAPTELETKMAELVTSLVPTIEKLRMVNSGTEATMSAIRVARGYTGRDKIIKMEGNFHGHGDSFLIKAGSGAMTLGEPNSPGVTYGTAQDTLTAPYNDPAAVESLLEEYEGKIAAIILEPVAGNSGCIPPKTGYLERLRELSDKHGTVLIFDEVMCGFRVAPGGAQQLYNVVADLVCYGKIIGAGMPVGAFGGKAEIMDVVSPVGPVYQSGTLSGNPVAMAAGIALLSELHDTPAIYDQLEQKSMYLENGLRNVLHKHGVTHTINRVGSMIGLFFCEGPVTDAETAQNTDTELFGRFFHEMLKEGVYLPPSPFESLFVSNAMDNDMIERTINAADNALPKVLESARN